MLTHRYDDALKLEFGTVSGDFIVASGYTHARQHTYMHRYTHTCTYTHTGTMML
jgi:hypothetical protein